MVLGFEGDNHLYIDKKDHIYCSKVSQNNDWFKLGDSHMHISFADSNHEYKKAKHTCKL